MMDLAACKQKQSKPVRHFGFAFAGVGLALLVVIGATNSNAQVSNNRNNWKTYEVTVEGKIYDVDAPDADTAWSWANQFHSDPSNRTSKQKYTPEEILKALRAADKAGNIEDAKKLALLYQRVTNSTKATLTEETTSSENNGEKSNIRTATNPKTGEKIVLIDGKWQEYTSSATGPNGAQAFSVGGNWVIVDDRGASTAAPVSPPTNEQRANVSTATSPPKSALDEYMSDEGALAASVASAKLAAAIVVVFGALAAALLYRLVRGSWSGTSATKVRRWAAWGAAWGAFFGASKIAQGVLWSNSDDLLQGLIITVVYAPALGGAGAFLAKISKNRNKDSEASAADAEQAKRDQAEREHADKAQSEKAQAEAEKDKTRPWYEVLGLDKNASDSNVTSAYKVLIAKYHPDKVSGLGEEFQIIAELRSREINNAYAAYKQQRGHQ